MSYTTVYKIDSDGDVIEYQDIQNAHRITMLIWELIYIKWFKLIENTIDKPTWLPEGEPVTFSILQVTGQMDAFWPLYRNLTVPREHRLVLGSTYDYTTIKKKDFDEMINAYEKFLVDLQYCEELGDFSGIKELIEVIKELKNDDDCQGMCMCISLISSHWEKYTEDGEYSAYNINKDTRHWDLIEDTNAKEASRNNQ